MERQREGERAMTRLVQKKGAPPYAIGGGASRMERQREGERAMTRLTPQKSLKNEKNEKK